MFRNTDVGKDWEPVTIVFSELRASEDLAGHGVH